jgi:hypothetical protein
LVRHGFAAAAVAAISTRLRPTIAALEGPHIEASVETAYALKSNAVRFQYR